MKDPANSNHFVCSLEVTTKVMGITGPDQVKQLGRVDIRICQRNEKVIVLHRFQVYGSFKESRDLLHFVNSVKKAE